MLLTLTPFVRAEDDLKRQTIVQRDCEIAIEGLPAGAAYDIQLALQRDAGAMYEG